MELYDRVMFCGSVWTIVYKGKHMTALKSLAFCVGWIITAYIGLWAMALYGVTMGIVAWNGRKV